MHFAPAFKAKINELTQLCQKIYPQHQNVVDAMKELADSLGPETKIKLLDLLQESENQNNLSQDSLYFLQALINEANTRLVFGNQDIDHLIIAAEEEEELDTQKRYARAEIKNMHYRVDKYIIPAWQKSLAETAKQALENALCAIERCHNFDELEEVLEKYEKIFDEIEENINYDL
ncbi:MAG: hypothetical protein ACOX3K_05830 [Bacilli bacterium]